MPPYVNPRAEQDWDEPAVAPGAKKKKRHLNRPEAGVLGMHPLLASPRRQARSQPRPFRRQFAKYLLQSDMRILAGGWGLQRFDAGNWFQYFRLGRFPEPDFVLM